MQVILETFQARIADLCHPDLPPCEQRYQTFATVDPFPEIAPALLHAGHIASYAVAAGMIDPFDPAKLV